MQNANEITLRSGIVQQSNFDDYEPTPPRRNAQGRSAHRPVDRSPHVIRWIDEAGFTPLPVAAYGIVLAMAAIG
jgi:hypothetical protein